MGDATLKTAAKVLIAPKRRVILLTEPPATASISKNPGEADEKPRIIDLGDKTVKMALNRQFNVDGGAGWTGPSRGELHYCVRMTDKSGKEFFIPKLPPGTVLVKQDKTAVTKPMESSISSLRRRLTQQIHGHSSKRVIQPEKNKSSQVRRNASRLSKKKIDADFPRPRLLALKRRGFDGNLGDEKRLKLSDVPYMNTRSVTKRLYNVGATLQVPNIQEEFEWRDWPTHGMHERPVYHPQVGLAAEFIGRCFTSFDGGSYQEIPKTVDDEIISPPVLPNETIWDQQRIGSKSDGNSFEDCMHRTFHAVLSYAALVMTPEYRKIEEKIVSSKPPTISIQPETKKPQNATMKGRSIDKIPQIFSAPLESSKPKLPKPQLNLMCIKNHAKLQQVLGRGKKNTLILLKTTDPNLKKESPSTSRVFTVSPPQSDKIEQKNSKSLEEKAISVKIEEKKIDWEKEAKEKEKSLKELIADTAVLYCTSMGVHQDDLVGYIDSLTPSECRNFMRA